MKSLWLIIMVVFLVGCSSTVYVCDDGSEVSDVTLCSPEAAQDDVAEPKETVTKEPVKPSEGTVIIEEPVEEEEPAPEPIIEEHLIPIFAEAENVNSYQFQFYGPHYTDEVVDIFVKKPKMKLVYQYPVKHTAYEFDTVYLDANGPKGSAYCEDTEKGPCVNPNFEFNAPYADFDIVTPEEWLPTVMFAEEESSEFIGSRKVLIVDTKWQDGSTGKMWVDEYYGLPLKVIANGVEYEYRDLVFNGIEDKEFKHTYIQPRKIEG